MVPWLWVGVWGSWQTTQAQPAPYSPLQVISDGVPLVLAMVPHRQSHSFTIQGSSDLLVSARGSAHPSSTPL